ncbi:hypothetical protein JMJ35_000699 [Cladonia borealis]|uniref:Transmembrane protein n=1 Tax=Cladonia borealis TaxID=184061 RepID=A0AA39V813_9LECA|nr:hypothetical protein JMJ35_000699 [Cladonia borealis]
MSPNTNTRPTPFKKRVLIPFWLAQSAFMLFFAVIYCLIESSQQAADEFSIRYLIYIFICFTGILLELVEIFLFSFHRLKPITYVIFQAAQMLIWLAMFLKEVVISINEEDSYVGYPNITLAAIPFVAVNSALLFTFIGSLIYASVLLRRHRRSKKRLLQSNILIRPLTSDQISSPENLTSTFPTELNSIPKNARTTAPELHHRAQDDVSGESMAEIPVRPPLPPYFDWLSSIGQAEGRLGAGSGKDEVFELAAMRGGRRGGIVVY